MVLGENVVEYGEGDIWMEVVPAVEDLADVAKTDVVEDAGVEDAGVELNNWQVDW